MLHQEPSSVLIPAYGSEKIRNALARQVGLGIQELCIVELIPDFRAAGGTVFEQIVLKHCFETVPVLVLNTFQHLVITDATGKAIQEIGTTKPDDDRFFAPAPIRFPFVVCQFFRRDVGA